LQILLADLELGEHEPDLGESELFMRDQLKAHAVDVAGARRIAGFQLFE